MYACHILSLINVSYFVVCQDLMDGFFMLRFRIGLHFETVVLGTAGRFGSDNCTIRLVPRRFKNHGNWQFNRHLNVSAVVLIFFFLPKLLDFADNIIWHYTWTLLVTLNVSALISEFVLSWLLLLISGLSSSQCNDYFNLFYTLRSAD